MVINRRVNMKKNFHPIVWTALLLAGPIPARAAQLQILRLGTNVVVSWPTQAVGFTLQSVDSVASGQTWLSVTDMPSVLNNTFAVTQSLGQRRFFRLSKTNDDSPAVTNLIAPA